MLLGRQPDNTDDTTACGVVVDLSILSAILLRYLVLTEIESVVSSSSCGVMRRHRRGRDAEKGQRSAERRAQRVRRPVEERARAAPGERGQVEGLGAPGGATNERGVVLEFDGETAGAAVVAELRERVGICVWVRLREGPAMSEDKAPGCNGRDGSEW